MGWAVEAVIAWQRTRFRDHWARLSRGTKPGRSVIAKEISELIQTMWQSNPTWGAPRIVGELRKLGIELAKSTVEKDRVQPRMPSSPTWKSFWKTHVRHLASLDFFVVPTVTHSVLFVLLIMAHKRRRVVHFSVTAHPTAQWTAQHVIAAFPGDEARQYWRRDRDRVYGGALQQRVQHMGTEEVLTAPRSPWQNPYVERLIGRIRRTCLDHVVILSERHLTRILTSFLAYYHPWYTHLTLEMDSSEWHSIRPPAGEIEGICRNLALRSQRVMATASR